MNDTFKYGDACESGDDKYVVAQFRSDASLAWVSDLRSFLNLAELKYQDFHPRRHQVMSNAEMWARLTHAAGVGNVASILRGSSKMVSEEKSQSIDHIQAADMAAGWAVDLLIFSHGDYVELAKRFAWVGVNGVVVPG